MGTTLDGQTLNVTDWADGVIAQASQWDAWSGSQYKRKVKVYGIIRTYTITFVENAVAWASSLAKRFEDDAAAGNTVTLFSDTATRPVSSVAVYILAVSFRLSMLGTQNIRKITVTVQEAQ